MTRSSRFRKLELALVLVVAPWLLVSPARAGPGDRGTGGIPAVLQKLDEVQQQLEENAAEIALLKQQVATLDANVTPCTLDRFRDGLCGADNHPLDLLVSVCGGVEAGAGVLLKYAFTSHLDVQAGIGWKDAPDVHIVENAQVPALLSLGPVPIVLPSELAGEAAAGVGLGLDGCLAPIRIPVGKQVAEPVVLEILEGLEMQAQPIADVLTARLNGDGMATATASATGPGMGLANLADALTAADTLRDAEIVDDNPMAAFGRGPIADLAGSLPVGNRVTSILDDPEQLALPGLGGGDGSGLAVAGLGPDGVFLNVCASGTPVPASIAPLCDFIDARIPGVDRVLELIPTIELIPNLVNDVVDGVRELLQPVFADVGETASNTLSRFCATAVGQRRIFDGLCGR